MEFCLPMIQYPTNLSDPLQPGPGFCVFALKGAVLSSGTNQPPRSTRFAHRHKLIEMRGQDEPFNVFPCAE